MDPLLQQIDGDLALADEAILRAPPRQLEFLTSPPTSPPQLAFRSCNISLQEYLDALYRLRDLSSRPSDRAVFSECLRFGTLHLKIVERIQRIHDYLRDCRLLLSTLSALPGCYTPNIGNLFDPIKQYIVDSRASRLSLVVPTPSKPTTDVSGVIQPSIVLPSIPRIAEATQLRSQRVAGPLNAEETRFVSARAADPLNAVETHIVSARVAAPRIADEITNIINHQTRPITTRQNTTASAVNTQPPSRAAAALLPLPRHPSSSTLARPLNVYVNEFSPVHFTELNRGYAFHSATVGRPLEVPTNVGTARYYSGNLYSLLSGFNHLLARDYGLINRLHEPNVPPVSRRSLGEWVACLRSHMCDEMCEAIIYCFVPLNRFRTMNVQESSIARHRRTSERANVILETETVPATYTAPTQQLRNDIIKEWQREMGTENQKGGVCACCSGAFRAVTLTAVDVNQVDFNLLRNDALPLNVLPTSYDLAAYNNALLNPDGLSHKNEKAGTISLCKSCKSDLTSKEPRMPLYSLANWLYYGYDRLPENVKDAFRSSSVFEKSLICRGRATRITFRYCKNPDSVEFGRNAATSQGYSKGNVIVMPQDSLSLSKSLPPTIDTIRDTMCVLFIGSSRIPVTDNIRTLAPCLVRKSRVAMMIQFLIANNPHYRPSDDFEGFSAENLEALSSQNTSEHEDFTPPSIEIGHLDPSVVPGEFEATADYTNRNDADPSDETTDDSNEDLLIDNVGYTDGDDSPVNYNMMRLRAVQHCLDGKAYLQSRSGSLAEKDFQNPRLLSWLFPHLDPWGIGGFHDERRKRPLSLSQQLRHLVSLKDSPFASDSAFAFVYQNISQKKQVTQSSLWRVKKQHHTSVTAKLAAVDVEILKQLEAKYERNPKYQPASDKEKEVMQLLSQLHSMNNRLPGSNGYKKRMRNELRGLLHRLGAPALFITINPSDVNNPLVRVVAGHDINLEDAERGEDLTKFMRQQLVAKNPHVAAEYFDRVINTFIKSVLRYNQKKPGLFGKCTAYYGSVEAQGKGTLHCHFLIWLDGHLPPQLLRDRISEDADFKAQIFEYLEAIMKCEPPGTTEVVFEEPGSCLEAPKRPPGVPNPAVIALPQCAELSKDEFEEQYQCAVKNLVVENHWHYHNKTCWKYLKRGEPKDDAHCRMRIDGGTRATTIIDPETESIMLRRLHPRINQYNDVLAFLTQSNNDIKFIGSGEAAKALIYYVTDYITKSTLPTHVGLSTLRVALEKNKKRFEADSLATSESVSRSLFVKVANGILSRQEMSHQQVMSYIMGRDDRYTSHNFGNLYWGVFDRGVTSHFKRSENIREETAVELEDANDGAPEAETEESGDRTLDAGTEESDELAPDAENDELEDPSHVTINLGDSRVSVTTNSQYDDYIYRSENTPFAESCLYEFVQKFRKVTIKRVDRNQGRVGESNQSERARNPVGNFLGDHPNALTHRLSQMTSEVVPVILGPTIPNPTKGAASREEWARAMLILFKPWRTPDDLKDSDETWLEAYERYEPSLECKRIIRNMHVLDECKDARDLDMSTRERHPIFANSAAGQMDEVERLNILLELEDAREVISGDMERCADKEDDLSSERRFISQALGIPVESNEDETPPSEEHHTTLVEENDDVEGNRLKQLATMMAKLKRQKRKRSQSGDTEIGLDEAETQHRDKRRHTLPVAESTTLMANREAQNRRNPNRVNTAQRTSADVVNDVITEFQLSSNPEQLRAFKIVADRVVRGGEQLLMYVGGVGGTGKSHLIKAIVELFRRLGRQNEIQLSAPTGAAGVIIDGATIHSLTMLPNKRNINADALEAIWNGKTFLVLDEISMVGASLLADISSRINLGKANEQTSRDRPFGSINVLFTGDFGQLKPVAERSLYDNKLVECIDERTASNPKGQNEILGATIWRQVSDVVLLQKNQRQINDPEYADMLGRVRLGMCISSGNRRGQPTDHSMLSSRILSHLTAANPDIPALFSDAPVIVGLKSIRDNINDVLLRKAAAKLGAPVFDYYSRDKLRGEELLENSKKKVWKVRSSMSNDALGILPLFPGMRVMLTENIAINSKLVNGAEGIVKHVDYRIDENGRRYAKACYVFVKGSAVQLDGFEADVVPILPISHSFTYKSQHNEQFPIQRLQLPLVPSYSYTDYKSQGRTLERAIVDLKSARSLQGLYVMLSRVKSLDGLAVLSEFPPTMLEQHLSQELRNELKRLADLDEQTRQAYDPLLHDDDAMLVDDEDYYMDIE